MRVRTTVALCVLLLSARAQAKHASCFKGTDPRTGVEIAVNELGKVTSCTVVVSSGSPIHDAASCKRSLPQLGIKPALQHGKPIASTARYWVSWACPVDPAFAPKHAESDTSWVKDGLDATRRPGELRIP